MKTVLSIAGSDPSGGAGIQADIKTLLAHGVYAMTAITALTVQNTTGVSGVMEVSPAFLEQELDAVLEDIPPDGIKIGMVSSAPLIRVIARKLKGLSPRPVVIDPVMVATGGGLLLAEDALQVLTQELLPLATLITPNIPEAEILSGISIQTERDRERAALCLSERYPSSALLIKGGHSRSGTGADDYLYQPGEGTWIRGERRENPNSHGTGCTLSSAITAHLVKGENLLTAVRQAKNYLSLILSAGLDLGKGCGPMDHGFGLSGPFLGSP